MAATIEEVDLGTKLLNCKLLDEEKEKLSKNGYKILHVINEGSCSLVYLAEFQGVIIDEHEVHRNVTMKLACKVMETEPAPKDFVKKFLLRELDIVSQISHPHIIHTHSILHLNTKIMVFMRNAELGNLCEYIINYGALREKQARIWFRQLAVALDYLHTINVVHRDIKCENILITCSFNIKLCDFGFSRFWADNVKGNLAYSRTFCGSIAYAAPELIKGTPYLPRSTDIWSLGVVLYIMLNGAMPFRTDNLGKIWEKQIRKDYSFRTALIHRASREVIYLVSRMLEPNCNERATIDEVLKSEWFELEPPLLHFTEMEEAALKNCDKVRRGAKIKMIMKIMNLQNTIKVPEKLQVASVIQHQSEYFNDSLLAIKSIH